MASFRLIVGNDVKNEAWEESYDLRLKVCDVEYYGRAIVEYFNLTLRPGERPRRFLGVSSVKPSRCGRMPKPEILNIMHMLYPHTRTGGTV